MACVIDANGSRLTLVIGIFSDPTGATRALDHLHRSAAGCSRLLPSLGAKGRDSFTDTKRFLCRALTIEETPLQTAERIPKGEIASLKVYRELTDQLAGGANVVMVRAEGPGQQLSASRILLQSSCDVLLTHECVSQT
jgi:hypothetical protein